MKKYIIALLFITNISNINAQKEDFTWLFGTWSDLSPIDTTTDYGVISVDFSKTIPINKKEWANIRLDFNRSSICDKDGNLLLFYNGVNIYNKKFNAVKNSDSLNYVAPINFLDAPQEYVPQGGLLLPYPDHPNQYFLLHIQVEWLVKGDSIWDIRGERLYYSIVDMDKENGLGEVIERKKLLLTDSLEYGKLTACRHANGKDWWIIAQENSTPRYHKILLSSDGIKVTDTQEIGTDNASSLGQVVFSPNGKYYINFDADVNQKRYCSIFDFDRCTGKLSNAKNLIHPIKTFIPAGGIAISPNSRFLYCILYESIYQYDLWATDLEKSRIKVAEYDDFLDDNNLPTRFFMGQLAPNGKIYISSTSGTTYLTVINKPDLLGDSCQIEQHSYKLLTHNAFGLPNLPNFRLGKAAQPCTVGVEDEVEKESIKIYPNPVTDILTIETTETLDNQTITILDMLGKTILSQQLSFGKNNINMGDIPSGTYILKVGNTTWKVVKM